MVERRASMINEPSSFSPNETGTKGLERLEARLAVDLEYLCYPGKEWVPTSRIGDAPVSDVVIIGGGMCGLVVWLALTTAGVRNIRIIDQSPEGFEGPWLNYARMETLRSPKPLTGPAFGIGSLTFQAWHRAKFGDKAWEELGKIPRPMWMEYLRWYRKALDIPVENNVELTEITPEGDFLRLKVSGAPARSILTRKLVDATGRDGTGRPTIPAFVDGISRNFWTHTADDIDFAALKGQRVAVVGVGASAVDNAAEALEAGAAEVRHLIRRDKMPTINKLMGIGSSGFVNGFATLPDEWRWRFIQYSFATQTPSPRGSTLRVSRHKNAYFHFGKSVNSVSEKSGGLLVAFADGTSLETDFLILGTGFTIDPIARTEYGAAAGDILLWRDVYQPPPGEESRNLGSFPYLNPDFSFREKIPGKAPWLNNVHCFNYAATASLGKVSGDIPGVSDGAAWLARMICERLYAEDIETHWKNLQEYDTPELLGDEWMPSPIELAAESGGRT